MKFDHWTIPHDVMADTQPAMQRGLHEVFVLWASSLASPRASCDVARVIVPRQRPGQTRSGVYVHIEGTELQRIQIDNFGRHEWNVVQLHTHPSSDVEMSALDREWEVVRHVGALSIIVPAYCTRGLRFFEGANVYEREEHDWRLWPPAEVSARFRFT